MLLLNLSLILLKLESSALDLPGGAFLPILHKQTDSNCQLWSTARLKKVSLRKIHQYIILVCSRIRSTVCLHFYSVLSRSLALSPSQQVDPRDILDCLQVDAAVVEVGLGGSLDATNVFSRESLQVAVITAIGLEHQRVLGEPSVLQYTKDSLPLGPSSQDLKIRMALLV